METNKPKKEHITLEAVKGWIGWAEEFDQKIWPIFKDRGYSKDVIMIVWHLNMIQNRIGDLAKEEGGEDWRE